MNQWQRHLLEKIKIISWNFTEWLKLPSLAMLNIYLTCKLHKLLCASNTGSFVVSVLVTTSIVPFLEPRCDHCLSTLANLLL